MVRNLAARLMENRDPLRDLWVIRYTAALDGIERAAIDNLLPTAETRRPPGTEYHANYFQDEPFHLTRNPTHGNHVPGADISLQVIYEGLTHGNIDDDETLKTAIISAVQTRVTL